nr:ChaN family lipoprotein [Desulfobulbaceae bacterium]
MQKKQFSRFLSGKNQIKSLSSALALSLLFFFSALPAGALEKRDDLMPEYRLAIAFDIEAQLLKGIATLEIPANLPLALSFSSFDIGAVELDGKQLSSDSNGISLAPSSAAQKLIVHYSKSFKNSDSDLVSTEGIALTGVWHPLPDRKCRFSLQASVPIGFEAVSEADTISQEISVSGKTFIFSFEQPLRGLHFAAGPYIVEQQSIPSNGVAVVSYFFAEDRELAAHYRQKAQDYIIRYEKLIGPYPYKRFSIVENRLPTGYGMPSMTLLGQMVVRLPFIVETSLGHEVLHSWFGNSIDVDQSSGNWCEGLTTYLADHAYAEEDGAGREYRKNQLLKNQHYVHGDKALAVKDFTGGDGRRTPEHLAHNAVGYGKVAMIFHMLAQKVGQDTFEAAIRDFYQRLKGKTASWDDIHESFDPYSSDLDLFFQQWVDRVGLPEVAAKDFKVDEVDGDLVVSFTLYQDDAQNPYLLDVPLELTTTNAVLSRTILLTQQQQQVEFKLAEYPVSLVIDSGYDLARQLSHEEVTPTWDWFKGSAHKIAVIGKPSDYDIFEPLIDEVERQGAEVIAANEVDDAQLTENGLIFFGITPPAVRSLFSKPSHPEQGFVVDVRKNPLNPDNPAVLVSASSLDEVKSGMAKLKHYGKYCYLHFEQGRAITKSICQAASGVGYGLERTPVVLEVPKAQGFTAMVDALLDKKIIYVGESHTSYADHKLQLRIIRELYQRDPNLAIGMEMFPRSSQVALDQFVAGEISEAQFLRDSKYFEVWSFDYRLYREILNFARSRNIPVIGLNIERKYVSKVYKEGGLSALGPEELSELPVDRDLDV